MQKYRTIFAIISLACFPLANLVAQPTSPTPIIKPPTPVHVPPTKISEKPVVHIIKDPSIDIGIAVGIRRVIERIYRPYSSKNVAPPAWENGYFSDGLFRKITAWRAATKGVEITNLSSYDWFCQCQDYDWQTAFLAPLHMERRYDDRDKIAVVVEFFPAKGSSNAPLMLLFAKQKSGSWRVDDMIFDRGVRLSTELAREIKTKGVE